MARKHFAVAAVLLALACLCQPVESRASGEIFGSDSDVLSSSMPMEFVVAGPQNGPLNPINRTFYFFNKSASNAPWTAAAEYAVAGQTWLTLSSTGGTLAAGAVTSVTLSFGNTVSAMDVGTYRANLLVTAGSTTIRKKVVLTILPASAPLSYYKFDETSGTAIKDYSGCGRDATLVGGCVLSPFAKAGLSSYANLTGAQGTVGAQLPPLNLNKVAYTACAWIYPNATMVNETGIVKYRGNGTNAGLHIKNVNNTVQLGLQWNDQGWGWNSGLVIPMNQWSFVAFTMSPTQARVYQYSGAGWKSASPTTDDFNSFALQSFNATGYVGWDSYANDRSFKGYIDEVRQYGFTMTEADLNQIALATAPAMMKASNPSPADVTGIGVLSKVLHWTPAMGQIDTQVVYAGTNRTGVTNATTVTSSYYLASTKGATAVLRTLSYTATYYWRVDTYRNGVLTKGDIWSFQAGQNPSGQPAPYAWYRLDDSTGTVARDAAAGARDGSVTGNARWIAGRNDGAIRLDRNGSSYVMLPALGTTGNSITFTGWIKPMATSVAGSTNLGIINYRTGTTSTGLVISNKGDLAGQWGNSFYVSNGLIPSYNTWNFVAMSVSPTTLTLYLNDGRGTGTKFVNFTGSFASLNFDGVGRIGNAEAGSALNHMFSGGIDDVRIFNQYMTPFQVYSTLETATPNLPDPATNIRPPYTGALTTFYWTAANAQVHDLFLSISTLDATPDSPIYVGTVYGPPTLGYSGLALQTKYTFMMDESNTGGLAVGTDTLTVRTIINAINNWMQYLN